MSITLPCVVGPYTNINKNLRLLKHQYRNSHLSANCPKSLENADERYCLLNELGRLNQYIAVNMIEAIEGIWALHIQQANPLDLNQLRDVWLMMKCTISRNFYLVSNIFELQSHQLDLIRGFMAAIEVEVNFLPNAQM